MSRQKLTYPLAKVFMDAGHDELSRWVSWVVGRVGNPSIFYPDHRSSVSLGSRYSTLFVV